MLGKRIGTIARDFSSMAYIFRCISYWHQFLPLFENNKKNKYQIMSIKEKEKNYKKPKISQFWNFLIYGSTIAIGIFLIWIYSAYIFINK